MDVSCKRFLCFASSFFGLIASAPLWMNAGRPVSASGHGAGQPPVSWKLIPPVTYQNLTVFPVVSTEQTDTSRFATLDEALASGAAIITEEGGYMRRSRDGYAMPQSGGAQVNQLVLINRGQKPLLLLAGEIVSGGKQDRIIGKDRIVPIGAEPLPLDVFCVEHGRWTDGADRFVAGQMMVHPSVRERAAVEQNQGEVWAAVRAGSAAGISGGFGTGSGAGMAGAPLPALSPRAISSVIAEDAPTESYRKIYASSPVGASVERFADEVDRRFRRATADLKGERVVGVVVAYGSEVAWSDVFASSELFDAYWPKLLRSYVVEALARPAQAEKVSLDDARDFLRPMTGHVREESEPGVYTWREQSDGREAAIELEALEPRAVPLHWLMVLRTTY
jgi:hypothetical protein